MALDMINPLHKKQQGNQAVEADQLSERHWVTKSNALIEKTYQLSVLEQKLILCLSSLVQPSDEDFRPYRIKVSDFVQLLGLKTTGKYTEVRKIVQALQQKPLPINTGQSLLDITWLSSAEYFHGRGYVELEFSPKLKPYLLQLKEKFTSYQLKNVIQLRSSYSIRIYELLKQYEQIGHRAFSLLELREMLGIPPEKYKLFGHFKDKVLNQSKKELEEKTDLNFEFLETKVGRKVTNIKFYIHKNILDTKQMTFNKGTDPKPQLEKILENSGIQSLMAKSLIKDFPVAQIQRNLDFSRTIQERKNLDNPTGFLIQAIKDDYASRIKLTHKKELPEYLRNTTEAPLSKGECDAKSVEKHLLETKELLVQINEYSPQKEAIVASRFRNEAIQYLTTLMEKRTHENLPLFQINEFNDAEIIDIYSNLLTVPHTLPIKKTAW